jgi:hypothetical protein
VHVGALADDAADLAQVGAVAALAASHCVVRRSAPLPLAALAALGQGLPVSLAAFASAKLQRWVRQVLETRPISAIFVFSGQMAQDVPPEFRGRVVMDFVGRRFGEVRGLCPDRRAAAPLARCARRGSLAPVRGIHGAPGDDEPLHQPRNAPCSKAGRQALPGPMCVRWAMV